MTLDHQTHTHIHSNIPGLLSCLSPTHAGRQAGNSLVRLMLGSLARLLLGSLVSWFRSLRGNITVRCFGLKWKTRTYNSKTCTNILPGFLVFFNFCLQNSLLPNLLVSSLAVFFSASCGSLHLFLSVRVTFTQHQKSGSFLLPTDSAASKRGPFLCV